MRYFDGNLEEIKEVKGRNKAIYGIDFENKEIELFAKSESAYPILTFDEIEKLKKLIEE